MLGGTMTGRSTFHLPVTVVMVMPGADERESSSPTPLALSSSTSAASRAIEPPRPAPPPPPPAPPAPPAPPTPPPIEEVDDEEAGEGVNRSKNCEQNWQIFFALYWCECGILRKCDSCMRDARLSSAVSPSRRAAKRSRCWRIDFQQMVFGKWSVSNFISHKPQRIFRLIPDAKASTGGGGW